MKRRLLPQRLALPSAREAHGGDVDGRVSGEQGIDLRLHVVVGRNDVEEILDDAEVEIDAECIGRQCNPTACHAVGACNDIAQMLALLHELQGAAFSRQVESIALHAVFTPYKSDANILIAGGEQKSDFDNLLNAARKAVSHGFRVFILPNPKGIRSADLILERKGLYKMSDLKTIQGKSSVINRLRESIGQTNRVLLNMSTDYNARLLASDIKTYFEENPSANEVMLFKGNKLILVNQGLVRNNMFNRIFRKMYEK